MTALGLGPFLPRPAEAKPVVAFPADDLHDLCRSVARDPIANWLGVRSAAGRDAVTLEAALRARLPGPATKAEWRAALVACGREDLTRGNVVDIEGRNITATEADFLGLGIRLLED